MRRVTWLLLLVAASSVSALGYGVIFQADFLYGESPLLAKVLGEVGLAALISLVPLTAVFISCRGKLNDLRQECRTLITSVLTARLGRRDAVSRLEEHGASEPSLVQILDTPFRNAVRPRPAPASGYQNEATA